MEIFFSPFAKKIVQRAPQLAIKFGYDCIISEQIFLATIDESLKNFKGRNVVIKVLKHFNINLYDLIEDIESSFDKPGTSVKRTGVPLSSIAETILKFAYLECKEFHTDKIDAIHILLGYLKLHSNFSKEILAVKYNLTYDRVKGYVKLLG
jgi:ATP-dependent Clp protease ATP-binding subunit ClpA